MALSLRKQSGRTLLVAVAGALLVSFFLNQSDLKVVSSFGSFGSPTNHNHQPHHQPASDIHRRIQDYRSPEYTAPAETGGRETNLVDRVDPKDDTQIKDGVALDIRDKEQNAGKAAIGEMPPNNDKAKDEEISDAGLQDAQRAEVVDDGGGDTGRSDKDLEAGVKEGKDKNSDYKNVFRWGNYPIDMANKNSLIDTLVGEARGVLAQEMQGYYFHPRLKARKMDDLVLERGGRPVRSVVITTWRSGSTFIGDVLQSHPATYYHYEPLLDFDINQIRFGESARQAIQNIRHLLTCNYTDMDHYLNYGPDHPWLFSHNTKLWTYCTRFPELCWDQDFLSPFCSLFPFQSLKTVRLRLNLTRDFLQDKTLGVQVLLLVRDPRGTMQSRRHRDWCPGNPDCDDPSKLCDDLVNDYYTAIDFRRRFPASFRVVRYEDLSFEAYNVTKELFNFFHLSYHPRVQEFLDTHTKEKIGGVSSTFRNSKTAPVHWQQDLSWERVGAIQKVCRKALKVWGYEIARDENHLRSFMPVGNFKFK